MGQYHFDPDAYLDLMSSEVPGYGRLQDGVAAAAAEVPVPVRRALELGTGTGETARRVLARLRPARPALVGIDVQDDMLERARRVLGDADLRVARLQDPLPDGPFELVFSALAVHHLDPAEKAQLFRRVAALLTPGGRLVLGDVVVPEDPADAVTLLSEGYDKPSGASDQLDWLAAAGLPASVAWSERDLAIIVAERPA